MGISVLAFGGGIAAVIFNPSLQKDLFVKALGASVNQCRLGYLRMGWNTLELQDLYILSDKGSFAVADLQLKASFLSLLFKQSITIDQLLVKGLEVDLSAIKALSPSQAAAGAVLIAGSQSTNAFNKHFTLPLWPLTIREMKIDGKLYFPENKALHFDLVGEGIAPDKKMGTCFANAQLQEKGKEVGRFQSNLTLLQETYDHQPSWTVGFIGNSWSKEFAKIMGLPFPNMGIDVRFTVALKPQEVKLEMLSARFLTGANQSLLDLNLQQPINIPLDGNWEPLMRLNGSILSLRAKALPLNLLDRFLASYQLEGKLQPFTLTLVGQRGNWIFNTEKPLCVRDCTLKKEKQLLIEEAGLDLNCKFALQPYLDKAGNFSFRQISFNRLGASLKDAYGKLLFNTELLQDLTLPINGDWRGLLKMKGDILSIQLNELPLKWVNPFLTGLSLEGSLGGLTGKFLVDKQTLRWASIDPLLLRELTLIENDSKLLENLNGSIRPNFETTHQHLKLGIEEMLLKTSEGESCLLGSVEATSNIGEQASLEHVKLSAYLSSRLPLLSEQPIFQGLSHLDSANLTFSIGLSSANQEKFVFQAKATCQDIAINPKKIFATIDADALPNAFNLEAHGKYARGDLDAHLSLLCEGKEDKTDLSLDLEKNAQRYVLDIKSDQFNVDDAIALSNIAQPHSPSAQAKEQQPTNSTEGRSSILRPDKEAFWSAIPPFYLKCAFNQLKSGKKNIGNTFVGRLKLDSERIELDTLTGTLLEAPFNMQGTVSFRQALAQPYQLKTSGSLKKLNIASALALVQPTRTPPIDGMLDTEFQVYGNGMTQKDLFNKIEGKFTMNSKKGSIYALQAAGESAQVGAMAVDLASTLLGKKTPPSVQIANELTGIIRKIDYDQFVLKAERTKDLNLKLSECLIQSPSLRISATGQVTYQEAHPLLDQPLNLTAQMDASGRAAQLMKRLNLLKSDEKDPSGFNLGPSFTIKGTLTQPDFSQLYVLIARAGSQLALAGKSDQTELQEDAQTIDAKKMKPLDLLKGILGG